ncbi:MAG: hypothetical protein AABX70_00650 [Nanoarchaeota archaeon]
MLNKSRLGKIAQLVKGKKVLVVGDVMLDHYVFLGGKRPSPERQG